MRGLSHRPDRRIPSHSKPLPPSPPRPRPHPHPASQKPKEQEWDAETILSTYTTTDNHPHMISVARRPRHARIELDRRTGLPLGVLLPAEEERARRQAEAGGGDDDDDDDDDVHAVAVNTGAPRPKKEGAEERRQRKQASKETKAERRVEKKGSKQAFNAERVKQVEVRQATVQLPGSSLSRC